MNLEAAEASKRNGRVATMMHDEWASRMVTTLNGEVEEAARKLTEVEVVKVRYRFSRFQQARTPSQRPPMSKAWRT